jgi:hypothetical protein
MTDSSTPAADRAAQNQNIFAPPSRRWPSQQATSNNPFAAAVLTSELGFGEAIGDFVGERLR